MKYFELGSRDPNKFEMRATHVLPDILAVSFNFRNMDVLMLAINECVVLSIFLFFRLSMTSQNSQF